MSSKQSYKTLLDVQIGTKAEVDDIHDEDDLIKLSLSVITIHLAKLVPLLTRYSLQKNDKPDTSVIVKELGKVLEYTFILCNSCNFDIPDDGYLEQFEDSIPYEVKNDSVLTVMGMLGAVADIFHTIYVEAEGPIWGSEELHSDLSEIVGTIILGMKHLGIKHGFSPDDVISQFA